MRKITIPLLILILTVSFTGCSKQQIEQNIIVQSVTNGRWLVTQFTENSTDLSSEFTIYEFQFYENGTVQAINGTNIISGTWSGDANAKTITSSFPGNNTTLNRLNDTWKIFNSSLTLVEANPLNTSRSAYLKLNKK